MIVVLQKPDFVDYDERGHVKTLYCKVCGAVIAQTIDGQFRRNSLYTEARFECIPEKADLPKSMHVSNGCSKCLTLDMNLDIAQAVHDADMQDLGMPKGRRVTQVLSVARGGQSA